MPNFAGFKSAVAPEVPSYVQAEIERAAADAKIKQYENEQMRSDLSGLTEAYNSYMGPDRNPIMDKLGSMQDDLVSALRGQSGPMNEAAVNADLGGPAQTYMPDGQGLNQDLMSNLNMGPAEMPMDNLSSGIDINSGINPELMLGAPDMAIDAGAEAVDQFAQPAIDGLAATAGDTAVDAATDSATAGMPLVAGLRGLSSLAEGDIGGVAESALKSYMATLGPLGIIGSFLF